MFHKALYFVTYFFPNSRNLGNNSQALKVLCEDLTKRTNDAWVTFEEEQTSSTSLSHTRYGIIIRPNTSVEKHTIYFSSCHKILSFSPLALDLPWLNEDICLALSPNELVSLTSLESIFNNKFRAVVHFFLILWKIIDTKCYNTNFSWTFDKPVFLLAKKPFKSIRWIA